MWSGIRSRQSDDADVRSCRSRVPFRSTACFFFGADLVPALLKLQALNGVPPLMNKCGGLFDALHVSTHDVAMVPAKGLLRLAKLTAMQHLERVVRCGATSPVGKDLLPHYIPTSLEPLARPA